MNQKNQPPKADEKADEAKEVAKAPVKLKHDYWDQEGVIRAVKVTQCAG